ncbi:multiheme c-type cytochrome [Fuerstiella marisgermanici]|uniref:Decaheme c-type cytochrome, DmsE family n=1 Tax=Fuerstiella marisgermanici TaxID=1891926 RepID=A0A1P8WK10_9PLAN|nr:multiheme c-type cytochrome [Fuerstiella marisgermanici]APZ94392.1 decaheme c-type cytochrome, DmsE family [Fuerstiella marisgermanici]
MNEIPAKRVWTTIATSIIALLGAFAVWASFSHEFTTPPRPVVLSRHSTNSQHRCAECHSDITDQFAQAPHSRTLSRATAPENQEAFVGRTFHNDLTDVSYHYEAGKDGIDIITDAYSRKVSAKWIFGSGTHARTPLITWTDRDGKTAGIEHSVSSYPSGELGLTLGAEDQKETSGIYCLGAVRGPAETVNCFGCHSTHLPVEDGRLAMDRIVPNIGCARCHWNTTEHVHEMDADLPTTIERFSELTPEQSVDRCGECHRRTEEMGAEVSPEDKSLGRFAPVGLTQSPCFQQQGSVTLSSGAQARLDCTSCHNPHGPTSHDWRDHAAVCLDCHDGAHDRAANCPKAARTDNCLTCHMPSVPANKHLHFTDHWIRIRDTEPTPENQ